MNTFVYSEKFDIFESLTKHNPAFKMNVGDKEYYIDDFGTIYEMNDGYDDHDRESFIRFVVVDGITETKVFDNVELFFNHNKVAKIDKAWFETLRQVSSDSNSSDFDVREDTHKLAIPRDINDGIGISRMRGKYLISNYEISNKDGLNDEFSIPYIKTRYRYSKI